MIITDTASYSDIVFGLVHLLRRQYRPQLADLPDQKLWRVDPTADYGLLNPAARGRVNLAQIHRHWPDIVRVAASIHTGAVRAYDVIRMIQRDGHPTPLGNAIAHEATMNRDQLLGLWRRAGELGLPDVPSVDGFLAELGLPEAELTTAVDVSAHLEVKRAAMVAHASQIGETSFFLAMPPLAFAAAFGTEWYRRRGASAGLVETDLFGED